MPYIVKDEGVEKVDERYCVYKKGEDGQPEGKSLGCHPSKEKADAQIAAIHANEGAKALLPEMEMRFRPGGAIRALEGRKLEVLAAPYGSVDDRDKLGEFFTARTDFMLEVGDRRPSLYFHGFTPDKRMSAKPKPIGVATATRVDDLGLWMVAELDDSALSNRVWKAAEAGTCRASTGAVNYLCRSAEDGEVEVWPIGELSLLDEGLARHPVNDKAVAMPLRASFEALDLEIPEAFGEDAGLRDETSQPVTWVETPTHEAIGESEMATEAEVVVKTKDEEKKPEIPKAEIEMAVRAVLEGREAKAKAEAEAKAALKAEAKAEVLKELQGEPKYRSIFAVNKEVNDKGLPAEKQATYEFIWKLRHGDPAFRALPLEESEAAEGGPMVPDDFLNEIWEKRDAVSIARIAGIRVFQTDRLVFNIPAESTPLVALPTVAEEGAYAANTPVFATVPATVVKKGSQISATEELLEDQDLFQSWLVRACGRAWGLAENVDLYAAIDDKAGVAIATKNVPTDAEILATYFALPQPYREGAVWIMNDATMAYMRGLLITTPRAYGDFPVFGGGAYETFMGHRVFTDANWPTLAVAVAGIEFLTFANLGEACALVERRGMKILVDPYTQAGSGYTVYYPSVRYCIQAVNTDAISNKSDLAD